MSESIQRSELSAAELAQIIKESRPGSSQSTTAIDALVARTLSLSHQLRSQTEKRSIRMK